MTGRIPCTAGHAHPTERLSTGQGGRSHGSGERSPPRPPAGRGSTLVHTYDRETPTRSDSLPEERVFSEQHRVFCFSPLVYSAAASHTRLFTLMRSSEVKLNATPGPEPCSVSPVRPYWTAQAGHLSSSGMPAAVCWRHPRACPLPSPQVQRRAQSRRCPANMRPQKARAPPLVPHRARPGD